MMDHLNFIVASGRFTQRNAAATERVEGARRATVETVLPVWPDFIV